MHQGSYFEENVMTGNGNDEVESGYALPNGAPPTELLRQRPHPWPSLSKQPDRRRESVPETVPARKLRKSHHVASDTRWIGCRSVGWVREHGTHRKGAFAGGTTTLSENLTFTPSRWVSPAATSHRSKGKRVADLWRNSGFQRRSVRKSNDGCRPAIFGFGDDLARPKRDLRRCSSRDRR